MSLTVNIRSDGAYRMALLALSGMDGPVYQQFCESAGEYFRVLDDDAPSSNADFQIRRQWFANVPDLDKIVRKLGKKLFKISADAKMTRLGTDEFFAEDSFKVAVRNASGGTVAEDVRIRPILCGKTDGAEGMDRYALVWQHLQGTRCQNIAKPRYQRVYSDWQFNLPDDVEEGNFEADAFYGVRPKIDRPVLSEDWCANGTSTSFYYIPREKMKALLAGHGEELGIEADKLKDLDGYIANGEFEWRADPQKLAEVLEEFLVQSTGAQWRPLGPGMLVCDKASNSRISYGWDYIDQMPYRGAATALQVSLTCRGAFQMALYGTDEPGCQALAEALRSGEVSLEDLSEGQNGEVKLSSGAKLARLGSDEFFAKDNIKLKVYFDSLTPTDLSWDYLAEDVRIKPIITRTGAEKGMDRYVRVWKNLAAKEESFYADWHYYLPDDVVKENFEADAFYCFRPLIDKSALNDNWLAWGYSSSHFYYIPKEKMKAILTEHGKEFGIDAAKLRDLDKYIAKTKFDWDVDPHRLEEILQEFVVILSKTASWCRGAAGLQAFDGDFKAVESIGPDPAGIARWCQRSTWPANYQ